MARASLRLEVFGDLAQAETAWEQLARDGAVATPYQSFAWIAAWQRNLGEPSGVSPFIVVGSDALGAPQLLLPLGRTIRGPLAVAKFLGGKHANFNVGLWRPSFASTMTAQNMAELVRQLGALQPRIDVLNLRSQPHEWNGLPNPLALLPHQPSPSFGYKGTLPSDFDERWGAHWQKRLRKKERSLAQVGAIRYWRAETDDDVHRIVDVFLTQKAQRMSELGLHNVFAEHGVREFITEAALAGLSKGAPSIELYAMSVGEHVVATYGGLAGGGRFCGLFNSMTRCPLAQKSPGELLLMHLVRTCCERGLSTFDLGVGKASYKDIVCDEAEPLFDSFVAVSPLGHLAALAARSRAQFKRFLKNTPVVWSTIQTVRKSALSSRAKP